MIENRKIHYKKMGKGAPILFIHGWGGTCYSLLNLATLASKNYTSILIDLPGFGKSDNPPPEWGVEGYANMIVQLIKELKLVKPHYVGHSFGGELGIYLSSHYPKLLHKLILCSASFKREKKISKLARILKGIPRNKFILLQFITPHLKKLYYKLFHKDSDLTKYPHLEANFRKIITQDLTADVKRVSNESLILWGEDDSMTPVLWAYELEKNIPHSTLKIFPKVRHNLPIKYPEEVWTEIEPFLRS